MRTEHSAQSDAAMGVLNGLYRMATLLETMEEQPGVAEVAAALADTTEDFIRLMVATGERIGTLTPEALLIAAEAFRELDEAKRGL